MKYMAAAITLFFISTTRAQELHWQSRAGAVSTGNSFTGAYIETGLYRQQNGLNLQFVWLDYCWCPCSDSAAVPDPVSKVKQAAVMYQRGIVRKKNLRVSVQTGIGLGQVWYREQRTPPVYKNGELVTPGVYTPPFSTYKAVIPVGIVTEFSPGRKQRQPGQIKPELWLGLRTGWQQVGRNGAVVIGLHLALTY